MADILFEKVKEITKLVDAEKYPAISEYLADLVDADELYDSPMDIATALQVNDPEKDLPQFLFDFIVELYKIEIEAGNIHAMNDLGALYYKGRGCEQDYTKAVYYYNMAAEHGDGQAQENLGYCYYYGRNMPVDYEKAFHYFSLGAFTGHLISLYKIGDMYQNGYYVKKNEKEAFGIYERCLETMTDEAAKFVAGPVYLRLGNAFLKGCGTEANAETALICYQKAEVFLYNMVKEGDSMYRGSLNAAIEGQSKAREILFGKLQ